MLNSLGLDEKTILFEIPKAEVIEPGDLSTLMRDLSRVYLLPGAFTSIYNSFAKSYKTFLSCKLARSTS